MPDLSFEQIRNIGYAIAAAKRYGLPESAFLGLLQHENGFNSKGGNGGGPGQITQSTAEGLGFKDRSVFEQNAELGIETAAKLYKQNLDHFKGDVRKAQAAYFVGAGTIDLAEQGGGDWLKNADALAKQYNQGTVTDYLKNTGVDSGLQGKTADQIQKETGIKLPGQQPGATGGGYTDPSKPPNPQDFYQDDGNGGKVLDYQGLQAATQLYTATMAGRKAQQDYTFGPYKQMVDDIISEISSGISRGQLQTTKANSMFSNRLNAYKLGYDALEGNAFKYGAPAGSKYVPGRAPGDPRVKAGLSPLEADQGNQVNPLAQAFQLAGQSDADLGAVQVPGSPSDYLGGMTLPQLNTWMQNTTVPPKAQLATSAPLILNGQPSSVQQEQAASQTLLEQLLARGLGG